MADKMLIPPSVSEGDAGKEKALKHVFAIVKGLASKLVGVGLTTDDLWSYVKVSHEVASRSDLTEKQRVVLAARLSAAERDPVLFRVLCGEVRQHKLSTLSENERLFDVIQRENKTLVDVTLWHSDVLYSCCVVNLDKMTVRGRDADVRRIVGYIRQADVNHLAVDMLKKVILEYVVKSCDVDIQTTPTLDAISKILRQHAGWIHLNDILEALNTDKEAYILEILRGFYRQKLIDHNPYGSGLWFRWKQRQ